MSKKLILLFDIDGTLLSIRKKPMVAVIEAVLNRLQMEVDLSTISYAGRTDAAIFSEIISCSSKPDLEFDVIKSTYTECFRTMLSAEDVYTYIDYEELDDFIQHTDCDHGILTGNFSTTARMKLDLGGYLKLGGQGFYGDIHRERRGLSLEALTHYSSLGLIKHPEQVVIIGDTPNDIDCARHAGFKSVAVTTGPFSREELMAHNPDFVVDSVRDLPEVLGV